MNHAIRRRAGLTLMELVVVLVILVALAGIVVPMMPNLLTNAHDATVTTNISEVNRAVGSYFTINLAYPDQFDSMVDTNGAMYTGAIWAPGNQFSALTFTPVTGGGAPAANGTQAFTLGTLQAGEDFSLQWGGINNLRQLNATPFAPATGPMQPNGGSATYNAYIDNVTGQLAAKMVPTKVGTPVIVADPNYIYQKMNMPLKYGTDGNPGRYLIFALGTKCTIVGATNFGLANAPMSFGEHQAETPQNNYARFLVVFRVFTDGSTRAEFCGTAHDDATGLGTADMHMQEFYQSNNR
jgi:Tfp pilus assembly protein PilE